MATLTNAQYTTLWDDIGKHLAQIRRAKYYVRDHKDSHALLYPRFENYDNGATRLVTNWKIDGVEVGVNTDADGRLYVDLLDETPGAGEAQVDVYKDSAMANLVLRGSALNGNTITLAEQNSSGLSGSVDIGTIAASDEFELIVLDPFQRRAKMFDTDNTDEDVEAALLSSVQAQMAICDTVDDRLGDIIDLLQNNTETYCILTTLKTILGDGSSDAVLYNYTEDEGAISLEYDGVLRTLFDAMTDDTKTLLQNTAAAGAWTAAATNTGTTTGTTRTAHEHCYDGDTVTVECTKTLDSTVEEFSVRSNVMGAGRYKLTLKKNWIDAHLGVALKVDRSITDSGAQAGAVASWSFTGETSTNTSGGVLYGRIENITGTRYVWLWNVQADRDADDTAASSLVASGSLVGDGVMTLTESNASGLSGSVTVTYASDGNFDVNLNICAVGDRWTVALTNDYAGKLQTIIGHLWHISLPSGVAASAEMADAICAVPEDLLLVTDFS